MLRVWIIGIGFDLELGSQGCGEKMCMPMISHSFDWIWMECGLLLRLVGLMNLSHTQFILSN